MLFVKSGFFVLEKGKMKKNIVFKTNIKHVQNIDIGITVAMLCERFNFMKHTLDDLYTKILKTLMNERIIINIIYEIKFCYKF